VDAGAQECREWLPSWRGARSAARWLWLQRMAPWLLLLLLLRA